MTKILTLDEMREVIATFNPEKAAEMATVLKAIGDQMVDTICAEFGLRSSPMKTTVEHPQLAGTAAPFYLKRRGQKQPEAFEDFDQGEAIDLYRDWWTKANEPRGL